MSALGVRPSDSCTLVHSLSLSLPLFLSPSLHMLPPTCTQCAGRTMGGSRPCLRNPVMCAKCCRYHGGCARHTALPGAAAVAAAPLPPPAAAPAQAAAPQPSAPSAAVPPPGSITAQLAQIWQALQHVSSVVAASSAAQVPLQPPQAVVPFQPPQPVAPLQAADMQPAAGQPATGPQPVLPPAVADGSAPPPLLGLLPPPSPPPASHLNVYGRAHLQARRGRHGGCEHVRPAVQWQEAQGSSVVGRQGRLLSPWPSRAH